MVTNTNAPVLHHIKWYSSSMPLNVAKELELSESQLQIKDITPQDLKQSEWYGKISHRRVIPTMLMPDGSTICESGAIVLYLLETYDKAGSLHPLPGSPNRAKFLQGIVYTVAECYPAVTELYNVTGFIPEEKRDQEKVKKAKERVQKIVLDHLKVELDNGKKEYYLGQFSAVDAMMGYAIMCAQYFGGGIVKKDPVIKAYFEKLSKRKAYNEIYSEDGHEHTNPDSQH